MWRFILTFGAGMVVGALGASYLAGVKDRLHQMCETMASHEQGNDNNAEAKAEA